MNTSPSDYLDKIAPKAPKPQLFKLNIKSVAALSVALVAVVVIAVAISSSIKSGAREPWQQLSLRLAAVEEITKSSTKAIKNSQLRSLNSELKIHISNTQRDLAPAFTSQQISLKTTPASVTQKETAIKEAALKNLEDGRLNAKYDSTYSREMGYQLSTVLALYQRLYAKSGPKTKVALNTAYNNLQPTQKAIADFSASTE